MVAGLPAVATQHPENLIRHQNYMKSANGRTASHISPEPYSEWPRYDIAAGASG